MSLKTFWCLWYFLFGLCIGSFLNVVIYRLPLNLSVARGRSFCPACKHPLSAADLVPVFSFLFLKRKCRYCGAPISWRYPLVELLTGLLFALCCFVYGYGTYSALLCLICCVLIVAWFIDLDHTYIPDRLHVILLGAALLSYFIGPEISLTSRFLGALILGGGMFAIAWFTNGGIGGGDIKLMACCGLLFGWQRMIPAFFFAYLLAALRWVPAYLAKKIPEHTEIPMAPYLAASVMLFALFGQRFIAFYLSLFTA